MDIADKVVVVTGAGGGFGRAIAQALSNEGAQLALVDINKDALSETLDTCRQGQARTYTCDVSREQAVEQLFARVVVDFDRVDGLVNNAGITRDALLVKVRDGKVVDKMSAAMWDQVMAVDLRGVFLCAREAAIKMIEGHGAQTAHKERGVVINISSISRGGNIGQTNYAAAKAGVDAMTVTWAAELARHGIRVAAIAPGFCDTPMVAGMNARMRERLTQRIPLGRLGRPEEIARTVLFIFHNEFVAGRVIEVDGGMRI